MTESTILSLDASQIDDLKLASSKMLGADRRAFQAVMALKYCEGNARQAEQVFGWGRETVQYLTFGSSAKTSDFIVDGLQAWWEEMSPEAQAQVMHLQFKVDNGPESSGVRTQFLKRMVDFARHTGKTLQLLYFPPITASTIRLNAAGASWNSIGMAPNWWMSKRCWSGRKA